MGSLRDTLLAAAVRRKKEIKVGEATFTVQEPSAMVFGEYGQLQKLGKREDGMALLLSECVVDSDGAQVLSREDALVVVKSTRLTTPIVQAIMEVAGVRVDEEEDDSKNS